MFLNPNNKEVSVDARKRRLRRIYILASVAVFLGTVLLVLRWYLPPIAVRLIEEMTNTQATVSSITINPNGAVAIRDLEIKPVEQHDYDSTILSAKKVYVRFGLWSLIRFQPRLKKISLKDFTLDFKQDMSDGRWNVQSMQLATGEQKGGAIPKVRFKNGLIQYNRITKGGRETVMSLPLNLRITPSKKNSYEFEVATAKEDHGEFNKLKGVFEQGHFKLEGSISTEDLPGIEQTWMIKDIQADYKYGTKGKFELTVNLEDFVRQSPKTDKQILARIKEYEQLETISNIQLFFEQYHLIGTFDLKLHAKGNLQKPEDMKVNGNIYCKDVSILYSEFPYSIEHLYGAISFSQKEILLDSLKGKHGDIDLTISGGIKDIGPDVKGRILISSNNMWLDEDLYNAIYDVQKKMWKDFDPAGRVKFKYSLDLASEKKGDFNLDVDLDGVNSTYAYFPYPLDNLTGNLLFDIESIKVTDMTSIKGKREIVINGDVTDTNSPNPKFDLVIDVDNIPIDHYLENSLPPREQNLYRQFAPEGQGQGRILVRNDANDANMVDFTATLNFVDTILKPNMLVLPITDITALGIFKPNSIEFREFEGKYGGQPISMTGFFEPSEDGKDLGYDMTLKSKSSEINDDLLNLIPENFRNVVSQFNPTGRIAYYADLWKTFDSDDMKSRVNIFMQDTNSQPEVVDFILENITGQINVDKGIVKLIGLKTHPAGKNNPELTINGKIVTSVETDDPEAGILSAEIKVDANNYIVEGKTLNDVHTTFRFDKQNQSWISDSFVGNFYDGKIAGKVRINHDEYQGYSFELQSSFNSADLQKFLADGENLPPDCNGGSCYSTGSLKGAANLSGLLGKKESFLGTCNIEVVNMKLGQTSPIAKILSLLSLNKPTDHIFEKMSFDGYIKDGRLLFEFIELSGKSLTLAGSGWLDITDKSLNLELNIRGPRVLEIKPDILASLGNVISSGVLKVRVTGNAYEPDIKIKPLPLLGDTFDVLGNIVRSDTPAKPKM